MRRELRDEEFQFKAVAAAEIAELAGAKVIRELPNETEAAGYSKATKALMDGSKLRALGWQAEYDIRMGIENTLNILMDTRRNQCSRRNSQ